MAIVGSGSEDAWQRECLIEITDGTSTMTLHGLTETVDIDTGERDLDVINLVNLGQIPKHGSIGLTTVTFEGYAKGAGTAAAGAADGFWDFFSQKPVQDASQPLALAITNDVTRFRVTILWTDETTATAASELIAAANKAKRFVLADCLVTACKQAFTDGIQKTTLTLKGAAFNNAGSARMKMESHDGTGVTDLAALAAYVQGTTPW